MFSLCLSAIMAEVMFYHLMDQPMDQALTALVEKSCARGWRVAIQSGDAERINALDMHLWTYREDSFLPHGRDGEQNPDAQPVWLTVHGENPNNANIRFLIDMAEVDDLTTYERVVYMFDGLNPDAVAHARGRWKADKAAGHALTYWQQSAEGRWEKKAG